MLEMSPDLSTPPRPVTPLTIIVQKLQQLAVLADTFPSVSADFRNSLTQVIALAKGLDPYIAASSTAESPNLSALATATGAADWKALHKTGETALALEQEMLSGHVEGQFLKLLVHALGARRILEIGLFTGYSALAMAEALPADGWLIACEIDPYAADFARAAFSKTAQAEQITIKLGPAIETLAKLTNQAAAFELIFIDADKREYTAYLEAILAGDLLAPGGLICVDNTLYQGEPWRPGEPSDNGRAIAAFNRFVAEDARLEQVLLPLRDGLTIIRCV